MSEKPLPEIVYTLKHITAVLTQANVAVPIIGATVIAVLEIIKALRGQAPPLRELIAEIERQAEANRLRGQAEIERLKALIG